MIILHNILIKKIIQIGLPIKKTDLLTYYKHIIY